MKMTHELQQIILVLKNIYDDIKVINPISKKILFDKNCSIVNEELCYEFCGSGRPCKNCVGMRAYNEERSFMKFSFVNDSPILITSMFIVVGNDKYIIETLKVMNDISLIHGMQFNNKDEFKKYIDNMNDEVIKDEKTGVFNRLYAYERLSTELEVSNQSTNNVSIGLLELTNSQNYEECLRDVKIFNIISIIASILNPKYEWISRIDDSKFLLVINRENEKLSHKVYGSIIDKLEKNSNSYNGLNYAISYFIYEHDLNNILYNPKKLVDHILSRVKRYN